MRRLIFSVILICAAWSAEGADLIQKGAEDLLRNSTLSQPFTILDQLLLGLDRKASEVAKYLRPEKNDFRPTRIVSPDASSTVSYDKTIARTVIQFNLTVSGIDDPWRGVCEKRIKDIVTFGLSLPYSEEWKQEMKLTAWGFFNGLLGPHLTSSDNAQLEKYKAFSDSIVVTLTFAVESGDRAKPLKFLRQCFWDNKTSQVTFREHKY